MFTHVHLGSICYQSEPLEVPYCPNQFLGLDFLLQFLTANRLQYQVKTHPVQENKKNPQKSIQKHSFMRLLSLALKTTNVHMYCILLECFFVKFCGFFITFNRKRKSRRRWTPRNNMFFGYSITSGLYSLVLKSTSTSKPKQRSGS